MLEVILGIAIVVLVALPPKYDPAIRLKEYFDGQRKKRNAK